MGDFDHVHAPPTLQAAMERAAGPQVGLELTFRPMFGGIMGYASGRPFASLSNRGLALKLGPADREALLALQGARPLRYEPDDPPSKTYALVPDPMIDDPDALRPWLSSAAAFVAAQPARKPKRGS